MRSPLNWALLGLVIQRPSYGYELVQRFERIYEDALEPPAPRRSTRPSTRCGGAR